MSDQTKTKPKYISQVSQTLTKNPLVIFVQRVRRCQSCLVAGVVSRNVPKGEQTVNWAGESPNYIPFQIRNQSQHLRWSNEQPSGNNAADQRAQGMGTGEVDDGFRMEGSRGRSLRRRRVGLTEAAFLLLAIKAIMRCHTIRVPTLKYDKTIQMLGIRFSSSLNSPPPHDLYRHRCPVVQILYIGKLGRVCFWFQEISWKSSSWGVVDFFGQKMNFVTSSDCNISSRGCIVPLSQLELLCYK